MNWGMLIPIIATNGIAMAEKLWQLFQKNDPPTQDDWNALKELGKTRAVNLMRQAILNAGLDPESDEAKALVSAATTDII